jgi:hypothetical protein
MFQTQQFLVSGSAQLGDSLILTNNSLFIADEGNVHAYSRSAGSWSEMSVLNPEGSYPLLAATDDMIVSSDSSNTFVFTKSGVAWSTTATLSGAAPAAAISGSSTLLVAKRDQGGSGFVFEQISSAWTQVAALAPSETLGYQSSCKIGLSKDAKVAGLCGQGNLSRSSPPLDPHPILLSPSHVIHFRRPWDSCLDSNCCLDSIGSWRRLFWDVCVCDFHYSSC